MGKAQEQETMSEMAAQELVMTGMEMGSPVTVRAPFMPKFRASD